MGEMSLIPPTGLEHRISPEYQAQQRELHEREPAYGTTSQLYIDQVMQLIGENNVASVLDYGCGKGALKHFLGNMVREYDPGIPGKDGEPEPADMVVCGDVLEHIEPDKLDSVLEHIRCLGKCHLFVVHTTPAQKVLSDGRNAHLIVQPESWWRKKLSVNFDIVTWDSSEKRLCCFAKPYVLIGEINGVGVWEYDKRMENIRANMKITQKRVKPEKFVPWSMPVDAHPPMFGCRLGFDEAGNTKWAVPKPHNRVAIVMCYGPSLTETLEMSVAEKLAMESEGTKVDVVSVSGAHDYLIKNGVVPRYHVECDPRPHKGDMIARRHPKVEYLMASCCHPDVVKKVNGKNLSLWHMNEGDPSLQILDYEPHTILIPGGGSVGLRSLALLYVMGYRRFIIHGMDCSYKDDASHAGAHTGKKIPPVAVRCSDGREFQTAPVLITYKRYFNDIRINHVGDADKDPTKIEVILRGDGLLQHWLKVSGGANSYETPEQVEAA
jgi:hypothetical protein